MTELAVQILAGLAVAFISGTIGFFIKKNFPTNIKMLPKSHTKAENYDYSRLSGKWHFYWLSYCPPSDAEPIWMRGGVILQTNKDRVQGTIELVNHPSMDLKYRIQGEIRAGKMILVDFGMEDEADINSSFWVNLRSGTRLVGIWNGTDYLQRPIAAPALLSRKEMAIEELNGAIKDSKLLLVSLGEYRLYTNQVAHNNP